MYAALIGGYRRFVTAYPYHRQGLSSPRRKPGTAGGPTHHPLYKSIQLFTAFPRTGFPLKMELIGCPISSLTNYQRNLRNIPGEWRPCWHRDGSLKKCIKHTS